MFLSFYILQGKRKFILSKTLAIQDPYRAIPFHIHTPPPIDKVIWLPLRPKKKIKVITRFFWGPSEKMQGNLVTVWKFKIFPILTLRKSQKHLPGLWKFSTYSSHPSENFICIFPSTLSENFVNWGGLKVAWRIHKHKLKNWVRITIPLVWTRWCKGPQTKMLPVLCALKIQYHRIPKSMVPHRSNTFPKVHVTLIFKSLWACYIEVKFPEVPVHNGMEQKVSGNLFQKFWSTCWGFYFFTEM